MFGDILSLAFPYPKNPHLNPQNYKERTFYIYQEAVFSLAYFFFKNVTVSLFSERIMRAKYMPSKQIVGRGLNTRYWDELHQFPDSQVCLSPLDSTTWLSFDKTRKEKKRKTFLHNQKKIRKADANRSKLYKNHIYYAPQTVSTHDIGWHLWSSWAAREADND